MVVQDFEYQDIIMTNWRLVIMASRTEFGGRPNKKALRRELL